MTGSPCPRLELQARLLTHLLVALRRAVLRLEAERQRQLRERLQRVDLAFDEFAPLQPRDPRDEREVVVLAPPLRASARPRADVAVIARLRIGPCEQRLEVALARRLEPRAHPAEVRGELVDAELLRSDRRNDPKALRPHALRERQELGVQTELQDRAGAGLARELGVFDLVRPAAENGARRGDLHEYVRPPLPRTVREPGLDDHVGAVVHRGEGPLDGDLVVWGLAQVDDVPPVRAQRLDVRPFVLEPAPEQRLELRIIEPRLPDLPRNRRHLEPYPVPAGEEVRQVCGGEAETTLLGLHLIPDYPTTPG